MIHLEVIFVCFLLDLFSKQPTSVRFGWPHDETDLCVIEVMAFIILVVSFEDDTRAFGPSALTEVTRSGSASQALLLGTVPHQLPLKDDASDEVATHLSTA